MQKGLLGGLFVVGCLVGAVLTFLVVNSSDNPDQDSVIAMQGTVTTRPFTEASPTTANATTATTAPASTMSTQGTTPEEAEFPYDESAEFAEAEMAEIEAEVGVAETPTNFVAPTGGAAVVCSNRFLHQQPSASPDAILKSIRDEPVEPQTNDAVSGTYANVYRNEYDADIIFPIGGDKFPVYRGVPGKKELFYINGSQNAMYLFPNPEDDIYLAPKAFHADVYGDFDKLYVDPYHNFNAANHTPGSATRLTDLDINLQETNSRYKPHRVITFAETNRNINNVDLSKGRLNLDERAALGGDWVSSAQRFTFDRVIWGVPAGVNTWWDASTESQYGVTCS